MARFDLAESAAVLVVAVTLLTWLGLAFFGSWVARQKYRRRGEGFALGLFLGPFGVLIEALLPNGEKPRARGRARSRGGLAVADSLADRDATDDEVAGWLGS